MLREWYRRKKLGQALKHQYQCHPAFDLHRDDDAIEVYWQKRPLVRLPRIESLQQQFSGNVFTIATGPSLNEIPFDALEPLTTLSLNCAIEQFEAYSMAPDFCLIVDHRIFEKHWESVRRSILSGAICFFSAVGLSRICEREPELFTMGKIYLIEAFDRQFGIARRTESDFLSALQSPDISFDPAFTPQYKSIGFSRNASLGFFSGKTVATWSVQLLSYLGYSRQFIVGMDLGGTGKTHFYGHSANKIPDFLADYEPHIRVCFELAASVARHHGEEIYNLSLQSTLPDSIIKKMHFEDALELIKRTP